MTTSAGRSDTSMDAYSTAGEILKGIELTPSQLAGLRAIDVKYQQELFARLSDRDEVGSPGSRRDRTLSEAEVEGLRRMLESDIRALLTPEQRAEVERRRELP